MRRASILILLIMLAVVAGVVAWRPSNGGPVINNQSPYSLVRPAFAQQGSAMHHEFWTNRVGQGLVRCLAAP